DCDAADTSCEPVEARSAQDERAGCNERREDERERPCHCGDAERDALPPVRPGLYPAPALDEHDDEGGRGAGQEDEERYGEGGWLQEREVDAVLVDDVRAAERGRKDGPERQPEPRPDRAAERGVEHAV